MSIIDENKTKLEEVLKPQPIKLNRAQRHRLMRLNSHKKRNKGPFPRYTDDNFKFVDCYNSSK